MKYCEFTEQEDRIEVTREVNTISIVLGVLIPIIVIIAAIVLIIVGYLTYRKKGSGSRGGGKGKKFRMYVA